EAAELAAAHPAEVHAELVRLRSREDLEDGEGLLEGLLGDPALLVDALVLDHRDLRRRPTPGERPELEETEEDRPRRVVRRRGICGGSRGGSLHPGSLAN